MSDILKPHPDASRPDTMTAVERESDLNPEEHKRWSEAMSCLRNLGDLFRELRQTIERDESFRAIFEDTAKRFELGLIEPARDKDSRVVYAYAALSEKIDALNKGRWFELEGRRVSRSSVEEYGWLTTVALTSVRSEFTKILRSASLINTFFRDQPEHGEEWRRIADQLNEVDQLARQLLTHLGVVPHDLHIGERFWPTSPEEKQRYQVGLLESAPFRDEPEIKKWLAAPERAQPQSGEPQSGQDQYVLDTASCGGDIVEGPKKGMSAPTRFQVGMTPPRK